MLRLLARGFSEQATADQADLSVRTVTAIMDKLKKLTGIADSLALLKFAEDIGLVRPEGSDPD